MSDVLRVFEHGVLPVRKPLTAARFDRLVQYNERHGGRFFEVGNHRLRFRSYVGVLQVGGLTIEVLPKADRDPELPGQTDKWRNALVEMLRQSGIVRLTVVSDARLRLRSPSLLEVCVESFLADVEELVHQGLVRKYRPRRGNESVLRGRLAFSEHIRRNLVHRERFLTDHVLYDRNNIYNQILCVALDVLSRVCLSPHLAASARRLSLCFGEVDQVQVTEATFSRLAMSRNTERYRRALQLARMIILDYSPDVRSGRENAFALLFDMNYLFERYVYAQLRWAEARQQRRQVAFRAQESWRFWTAGSVRRSIRPDVVAYIQDGRGSERVVLDTKWKTPRTGAPDDGDLQQVYAYNSQIGARRGFLLYPRVASEGDVTGGFAASQPPFVSPGHYCGMMFLDLFRGDRLRSDLGEDVVRRLVPDEEQGEV